MRRVMTGVAQAVIQPQYSGISALASGGDIPDPPDLERVMLISSICSYAIFRLMWL